MTEQKKESIGLFNLIQDISGSITGSSEISKLSSEILPDFLNKSPLEMAGKIYDKVGKAQEALLKRGENKEETGHSR